MRYFEGLKRQFVLMHVSGIPVRADMRWLFVIALMSMIYAAGLTQLTGSGTAAVVLGFITTLVFFLSIFLHEYAHAAVARMENLRVVEIVLHPFGGLTRFAHEPETPRAEFRIAIAGPAASFLLAVFFAVLATIATSSEAQVLIIITGSLALLNFLIAVFNMMPGYPLDGGRVLRAYLWRSGRDLSEATILTGRCGQAIAVIMMVFGLFAAILRSDFFTGFWAMLVGLFLWDSAKGIIAEVRRQERTPVEEAMMLPVSVVPEKTIQDLIDNVLPMHRQEWFPVARDHKLLGILRLIDMKKLDRAKWRDTTVGEIMRAVEGDHFVDVGTSLTDARETARSNGVGAVCVINAKGELVGTIRAVSKR